MKVYAINLERAVERRAHILRQLKKHKLDYELISAVDGKKLSDEELNRLCDLAAVRARPDKLTAGAIGCALSHLKAYQKMIADQVETALILEDDAVLPSEINQLLDLIDGHIKTREAILLHYFKLKPEKTILSRCDAVLLDEQYSLLHPVNFPLSGTGYVITRETAEALSQIKLPIRVEADDWRYFLEKGAINSLRCVYPKPLIVSQYQTQIQPLTDYRDVVRWRHKIYKFITDNRIPILHPMMRGFSAWKERSADAVILVDQPVRI